ncbi:sterol homeostasis protein [Arachnomyces sp. PD_36]|nr:sterol homeostasis protein [Arachnomyces sp. PD_36]
MPICIECSYPVSHLYTSHSNADVAEGVRLTQCPRCKRFADKYVEHDFVVLFIDLVLIKRQVYRHLLFNRLGRDDNKFNPSIIRLGILLLLFDVYLTWARIEKSSSLAATPFATAPIPIQYLFFLTLSALATLAHHLTVRFLASFIRKPPQASTTSENGIGDNGNGSGNSSNNLASPSDASTPVQQLPFKDASNQQGTVPMPPPSTASRPSRPASSSGSASFPNGAQPSSHGLPPPLPPRRSSTTPVHAQPSSPPSPPSPSAISTALLVSSCTKLFPILLVIWGSDNGADTAANVNMTSDINNIDKNHLTPASAVTGTAVRMTVALISKSPPPLKSIASAATRTLTSTATAASAAASVATTPLGTAGSTLPSSPFSFLHSLLSLTITNTHLVLLNNIEALLILLDCGYVPATALAVAGQLARWSVETAILNLVTAG